MNTVWIVFYDEDYLGGQDYTLYHICSTEEKAKEAFMATYRTMHDDNVTDYEDSYKNHGFGIEEWDVL